MDTLVLDSDDSQEDAVVNFFEIPGMDTLKVLDSDDSQEDAVVNSFEAGKDVSDLAEEDVKFLDVLIDLKQENNEYLDLRNPNVKYLCFHCKIYDKKESSLRKHLIKHTSDCKICDKVFKDRYSQKNAQEDTSGKKMF